VLNPIPLSREARSLASNQGDNLQSNSADLFKMKGLPLLTSSSNQASKISGCLNGAQIVPQLTKMTEFSPNLSKAPSKKSLMADSLSVIKLVVGSRVLLRRLSSIPGPVE